ncbi:hypothetical protein ACIPW4_15210 [Pseudomonas sp. NPDC089996]|uniref:hypothetical protein n=1 Tax=Pseudomonas sp. NPDC089996 TaxID=3364474 RepID=UPI003815A922
MIDFDKAISVAEANVKKLVKTATNLEVEGALISSDGKLYEVTFSYDRLSPDADALPDGTPNTFKTLANLLSKRREYKVFLIDSETGEFKGFKSQKEA